MKVELYSILDWTKTKPDAHLKLWTQTVTLVANTQKKHHVFAIPYECFSTSV